MHTLRALALPFGNKRSARRNLRTSNESESQGAKRLKPQAIHSPLRTIIQAPRTSTRLIIAFTKSALALEAARGPDLPPRACKCWCCNHTAQSGKKQNKKKKKKKKD